MQIIVILPLSIPEKIPQYGEFDLGTSVYIRPTLNLNAPFRQPDPDGTKILYTVVQAYVACGSLT
jgi:hypothetical protein